LSDFHLNLFYSTDFKNILRNKFHENLSSGSRINKRGQKDRKLDGDERSNRRFRESRKRLKMTAKYLTPYHLFWVNVGQLIFEKLPQFQKAQHKAWINHYVFFLWKYLIDLRREKLDKISLHGTVPESRLTGTLLSLLSSHEIHSSSIEKHKWSTHP